jgi:transcription factor CP2-like protein
LIDSIVAKVDDEMLKHYCHEDTFLLEVKASENEDAFDLTIVEQPLNLDTLPNP